MTLNDLLRQGRSITEQLNSGDIPLIDAEGKEVNIQLALSQSEGVPICEMAFVRRGLDDMTDMTDMNRGLLLKDLSARLPWGVKVLTSNDQDAYTLLALSPNKNIAVIGFEMDGMYVTSKVRIEDCKPLLRPMSSMSDREKREYWNTQSIWQADYCAPDYIDTLETYDWLNAHPFDYRGLIEKGLAIAVTKENNPY